MITLSPVDVENANTVMDRFAELEPSLRAEAARHFSDTLALNALAAAGMVSALAEPQYNVLTFGPLDLEEWVQFRSHLAAVA